MPDQLVVSTCSNFLFSSFTELKKKKKIIYLQPFFLFSVLTSSSHKQHNSNYPKTNHIYIRNHGFTNTKTKSC